MAAKGGITTATNGLGISTDNHKICIVMVGLPARGKSLIARKGETDSVTSTVSQDPSKDSVYMFSIPPPPPGPGPPSAGRVTNPGAVSSSSSSSSSSSCLPGSETPLQVEILQAETQSLYEKRLGLPPQERVADIYIGAAQRYFKWLAIESRVFNVGEYRRNGAPTPDASFFERNNLEGERIRRAAAEEALKDMVKWFDETDGTIAIFDATNSTRNRRRWIHDSCAAHGIETLFVESLCQDPEIVTSNILEVKLTSPDYAGKDPEEAVRDFKDRISIYEKVYESINSEGDETDLSYTQIINVGANVVINNVRNYLQSRVVYYLMNLHIKPRSIWLSRHGESEFNLTGQIGGDASLSPNGTEYSKKLPQMLRDSVGDDSKLTVWTSTLRRTIATAKYLPEDYQRLQWKALDELDAGVCDGLTYQEIADKYPEDFKARDDDKFNYRYRGGESYRDVVTRLEPIIMELERAGDRDILIITHQAVLRCIVAYFMGRERSESPWMNVPLHTLIKLTPKAYGTTKDMIPANIEAVSTWRGKGSTAKHEMEVPDEYKA